MGGFIRGKRISEDLLTFKSHNKGGMCFGQMVCLSYKENEEKRRVCYTAPLETSSRTFHELLLYCFFFLTCNQNRKSASLKVTRKVVRSRIYPNTRIIFN